MPRFDVEPTIETRVFPSGSVVVPLAQTRRQSDPEPARATSTRLTRALGILQCDLRRKGIRRTLRARSHSPARCWQTIPHLKQEFEQLLALDPEFAASPAARLRFFYKRSPYWDPQMNLYPVGRIISVD